MGGAGIGLIAKVADRAGIDAILAYNTGPFRMDGHGSFAGYLAYGDSNAITLELGSKLLPVVENTPVIAGIGAADPYRDIGRLMTEMIDIGFSGIINVPTTGLYGGDMREHIDHTGLGYPEEIKLTRMCRETGYFLMCLRIQSRRKQEDGRGWCGCGSSPCKLHHRGFGGSQGRCRCLIWTKLAARLRRCASLHGK